MKIKLLKQHTHVGQKRQRDDVIEVPEMTANWLIKNGVGMAVKKKLEAEHEYNQ